MTSYELIFSALKRFKNIERRLGGSDSKLK